MFRVSPPILSTVPRSGTWFLRYAISFLCHLERGGRIDDRLTKEVFGDPSGPPFDFHRFKGGPLFGVRGVLPAKHLFIGHAVCPGFDADAAGLDWWAKTPFHVPGYDYFHEGMDYRQTPVDLVPYENAAVSVGALERAARKGSGGRIALVYRNPIDQARSYLRYCRKHKSSTYNLLAGRPLSAVSVREYLLKHALPSYAKQFVSFQAMADRHPGRVLLAPYEHLMQQPIDILADVLDHLTDKADRQWHALGDAVWLARREHLKAVEKEIGRSLDGTRQGDNSHITQVNDAADTMIDDRTRTDAIAMLGDMGVNIDLFEWPVADKRASAA